MVPVPVGDMFAWDPSFAYVRRQPYFDGLATHPGPLGVSVTSDHISPAGGIKADSPADRYLREHSMEPADFNSYGSRCGNHEVMIRATFANIRVRSQCTPAPKAASPASWPAASR